MQFQTFLSPEIYNFIHLCGTKADTGSNNKYISTNLTINCNEIESLFSDCNENFVIHDQPDDWFRLKIKLIQEIMFEASNNLNNASVEIISQLWERSLWTDRIVDIRKCYEYFRSNNQSDLLKSVLILTSIIERALGNVYRIENKNVPFLLKDLLETKYMMTLFKNGTIRFLQILFGTSKALNIRNISWHGFLSLNELNQNHIAILFIVIAFLGDRLKLKNIESTNIPYRPQITNLEQKINEITSRNNSFVGLFNKDLNQIIQSYFIGPTHFEFWVQISLHTPENCQNNCIILLLPLFEHLFRRIFCKVNLCDDRNAVALQKEKYTTLDGIFAEKLDDKPNKLLELLGKGSVDFYEDLFSHLSGPRIRDKFSHGEIVLQSISCKLTEMVLNLIVHCIAKTTESTIENTDLIKELSRNFDNYESVYHPNTILKYKILQAYTEINKMLNIPKPPATEYEKTEKYNYSFNKLTKKCFKLLNNSNFKVFVETTVIPTLYRSKEELKLVKKLLKITEKVIDISQQIINDNEARYKSFLDKTLGSRQINRYDEILKSISVVFDVLNCILHVVVVTMHKQFSQNDVNFKFGRPIFKFLQSTLCFEDKIERYSNVKINKWVKVRTLTSEYEKQLNYTFEKHIKNQ